MLGFYDYTVVLTYASLISATMGIMISLMEGGHPYFGTFFLLFCGLCDAYDGKVARTKKDRTEQEMKFGIQIDSLSDLVAFGVLPACIGWAMLWNCPTLASLPRLHTGDWRDFIIPILCFSAMMLYVLAALIRLAYFNVMEEERQEAEGGVRKYYEGVPVTTAALLFPAVMLMQFLTPPDITVIYFIWLAVMAVLFVSKIKVRKPGVKGVALMVAFGVLEFVILWIMF